MPNRPRNTFSRGAGLLLAFALNASPAAQTPEQLAETFDPEQRIALEGDRIQFLLPSGMQARILASTFEQVLDLEGRIRRPLSQVTTQLTFELSDGQQTSTPVTVSLAIPPRVPARPGANAKPAVVPALQEWQGAEGSFIPGPGIRLVIAEKDANRGNPSLRQRMQVFAEDFTALTGLELPIVIADRANAGDIQIQLLTASGNHPLGPEAYQLSVTNRIVIRASDPLGAFWGTRTLLQVLKSQDNRFPCGTAVDYPRYPVRGFMYDVGRKPASLEAVRRVMKTLSWYKLNDFQLHLNDNFIWLNDYTDIPNTREATPAQKQAAIREVMDAAPTAFRLESSITGVDGTPLTATDHFYTKEAFGQLIDEARLYGVRIVPEIDVPGHAMSLVRVRPDLMYRGKLSKPHDVERTAMLDASEEIFDPATGRTYREETLDFVKQVFDEYLTAPEGKEPVFRDGVVHIGTDEYYGSAEDYRAFADALLGHIQDRGFTPRLWGSLRAKPGNTPVRSEGVQMHIWSLGWASPVQSLEAGYDIINIQDVTSYIVPNGTGNVGGYGDYLNLPYLYSPEWQPHRMGQERVAPGHPKLLGAQWALWNDNSFRRDTGLTDYDLFDRIQKSSAVMAEKTWSTGTDRPYAAFAQLLEQVGDAPGVHRYQVQTRTPLALDLRVIDGKWGDHSGNGYSPTEMEQVRVSASGALELQGGRSFVRNAVANIAPDYVAEFRVRRSSASTDPQILFESHTGQFWAVQKQTGRIGLTRDTWDYSFDYTLPVGKWVDLKLVATGRSLTLFANGEKVGGPVRHRYPDALRYNTFIFPMEYLGSRTQAFEGQIQNLNVTVVPPPDMSRAVPSSQLEIRASSEHGVGVDGDIQKTTDGDPGTYWHSRYAPKDEPPFEVEIRLNTPTRIDMLSFLPRQDMNNGAIRSARLLVKSGKSDWEEVATYTGTGSERSRQAVAFSPRTVDAVKWIITEGVGGFGTMAEINLHSVR